MPKLFLFLILFTIPFFYEPVAQNQSDTLRVRITNIKQDTGSLRLALYDKREYFLTEEAVQGVEVPVKMPEMEVELKGVAYGQYAVCVFHDINNNSKLDANFIRIPQEPYGFSNGRSKFIQIPNFEKSLFYFNPERKVIEIALN